MTKKVKTQEVSKEDIKVAEETNENEANETQFEEGTKDNDPCWKDYEQKGVKEKGGETVPNCVKKESDYKDDEDEDDDKSEKESKASKKYTMKEETLTEFKKIVAEQKDVPKEFASKISTMFEAIVNETVSQAVEEIIAEQDDVVKDAVDEAIEEIASTLDTYVDSRINEWTKENQHALESELKVEKANNLYEGIVALLKENNITLSEEESTIVKESQDKAINLEKKVNEQTEEILKLRKKIDEDAREKTFAELTVDLTESQKTRLSGLLENIKIKDSREFKTKVTELKESIFSDKMNDGSKILEENNVDIVNNDVSKTSYSLDDIF